MMFITFKSVAQGCFQSFKIFQKRLIAHWSSPKSASQLKITLATLWSCSTVVVRGANEVHKMCTCRALFLFSSCYTWSVPASVQLSDRLFFLFSRSKSASLWDTLSHNVEGKDRIVLGATYLPNAVNQCCISCPNSQFRLF